MKARLAVIVAASACLLIAGAPAFAQQAPQNTVTPAQNGVVGNPQLKDFSLNGTVTKAAPAQPPKTSATQSRQPAPRPAAPAPVAPTGRSPSPSNADAPDRTPTRDRTVPTPSTSGADLPPSAITEMPSPVGSQAPVPVTSEVNDSSAVPSSGVFPTLAWIVAGLAVAAAAAWFVFSRRRPPESLAGAGSIDLFDARPSLASQPAAPVSSPQPEPATPAKPEPQFTGVVSTRLRPWLEIRFNPDRGVVDDQKAAIAFEVSVHNAGNMPARDVLIEAALFNAGPMQDQHMQRFFDHPIAKGDRIPVIPPMQSVSVNTAVFLARDQVQPIEMEGRTFFIPMVAFNALYNWGSSKGQTSASYLVGKDTGAEKLAPFRLDLGPRIFRGLAAREHELRLRR